MRHTAIEFTHGTDNGSACLRCASTCWMFGLWPHHENQWFARCNACDTVEGPFAAPADSFAGDLRATHSKVFHPTSYEAVNPHDYWTVKINYQQNGRTKWHPTEATGPFSTLTRGAFKSRDAACIWASRELGPGQWMAIHVTD